MKIGDNTGGSYQSSGIRQEDSVTASIRQQINEAKKQLQEVAADKNLSVQQKSDKKKELTDTINDLNQQLRQHELDKKQEQLKKAAEAIRDQQQTTQTTGKKEEDAKTAPSLSTAAMQAIAAAETVKDTVTVKEGVRMDLSFEARRMSNAIKREELDGGVSPLRKDLNELYGVIGDLSGEIIATLEEASDALDQSLSKKEPAEEGETAEAGEAEGENASTALASDQEPEETTAT